MTEAGRTTTGPGPSILSYSLVAITVVLLAASGAVHAEVPAEEDPLLVVTQMPLEASDAEAASSLQTLNCAGARIVTVRAGARQRVLTEGFHGACDPEISFEGGHLLFAGRRRPSDPWNIYEMNLDDGSVRQVTRGAGNFRNPVYLGTFYTIVSPEPWRQIAFVGDGTGEANEHGGTPSTSLFSCKLDGSGLRRLTYNPSSDADPTVLPDGRLLFSSWQRSTLRWGASGRVGLFASQTDGIDYALFAADEGRRIKRMPAVTTDRRVLFVESDEPTWDGAGSLASVSLRRNLHSHQEIPGAGNGLFHSPSPLPEGEVLVSRRPANGEGSHGVYRLDPRTGELEAVFDDPQYHDVQARRLAPRQPPDGRSSVLTEERPTGLLYGLDLYESDRPGWISRGQAKRLRVLEGIPLGPGDAPAGIPPLLQRRFLGEVPIEEDGSFNLEVPANVPIELQLLDADGLALEACGWIWVRNRETRGCIGCHEDGERTPENRFVGALARPSIPLVLPPDRRRTVDFRRDVVPILSGKCAACHSGPETPPAFGDASTEPEAAYEALLAGFDIHASAPLGDHVHPGRARTSPLAWHVLGKNTTRPWDRHTDPRATADPPEAARPLTDDEKRTIVEWIDLGALWDGLPGGEAAARGGAR